jgi:release factor glutamine methyltransferase
MSQEFEWLLAEKYNGVKSDAFYADFKRLSLGEPLGYLIGHIPFLNCHIWLDSRPLIPRPETEYWTEKAIAEIKKTTSTTQAMHVLDLCAGSGCVGVAVAKALPTAHVDFSEIDAKHIPTIEKNLSSNGIAGERTNVYQTNLFQNIKNRYNFILANPPYINADLNQTDDSVIDFEPHLALFGGVGGLEIIEQLIEAAPAHLEPRGQLWIEHDPEQSVAITTIATQHGFTCTTHLDQFKVKRYSILMLQ